MFSPQKKKKKKIKVIEVLTPENSGGIYRRCDIYIMKKKKNRRKRGEKEAGDIFEVVVADSFAKFMKDTRPQIQEAQKIPRRINTKKIYT